MSKMDSSLKDSHIEVEIIHDSQKYVAKANLNFEPTGETFFGPEMEHRKILKAQLKLFGKYYSLETMDSATLHEEIPGSCSGDTPAFDPGSSTSGGHATSDSNQKLNLLIDLLINALNGLRSIPHK